MRAVEQPALPGPLALMLALGFVLASCRPSVEASFDSPEPGARNRAIVAASRSRNPSHVPDLVRMLDSDDPVTRLLAIRTLEDITGETLGYDHAADPAERRRAVARWEERVRAGAEATPPSRPEEAVTTP